MRLRGEFKSISVPGNPSGEIMSSKGNKRSDWYIGPVTRDGYSVIFGFVSVKMVTSYEGSNDLSLVCQIV